MDPLRTPPVVHLELHTPDLRGASAFYGELCGWPSERVRTAHGAYLALALGNGLGGGIVECDTPRSLWLPYVSVGDIECATGRAQDLGAELLLAPREGPGGWRSVVRSQNGGELAFWQPKR